MITFRTRINNVRISNMIASRKRINIKYSESPGFEGTDSALILAQIKVYEAILILNCPEWAITGDKYFRKYLKKFNLKVPSYDFEWIEKYVPAFWDAFRFVMLDPKHSGRFEPKVLDELRSEFLKLFNEMPSRFQYKRGIENEAVDLMLVSLKVCLDSDNQLLANPIFEIVLLLWYHYLDHLGELRG